METTNPIFRNLQSDKLLSEDGTRYAEGTRLPGVFRRTIVLLLLFASSLTVTWLEASTLQHGDKGRSLILLALVLLCALGGTILVWITIFKHRLSPITAPLYALMQGVVVGAISVGVDRRYPGIAIRAVALTIVLCFCLLTAYRFHIIRVTESFNRKLTVAISGVVIYYGVSFAIALIWGHTALQVLGGTPGILISVMIVIIAGLSLISNLDFVVKCAEEKVPSFMEWYAAMGLLLALIWLYLEVLDLLSKAQKARN